MAHTAPRTISSERLHGRLEALSQIGRLGETGVRRLALTKEDKEGVLLVKSWMEEAGLQTRIDAFGNLIGRLEGADPAAPVLMLGSHIDSQPYGGRFDGAIGVLGALEAVQTLIEDGVMPGMAVEVAAFCDEEGCRFNKGLFGVRGLTGRLEEGELDRADADGITRRQALEAFGCTPDPEAFAASQYPAASVAAYLELHIEQGPVLEALEQPVGIVTGIAGPLWLTVELTGFAGHAGSVPMLLRQDALVGAAKIIAGLNALAGEEPGAPTVGTVGSLNVFPNSRNIIPERVSFTVDLRDIDLERREAIELRLRRLIDETAEAHGLTVVIREDTNSEPRYCAPWIKALLREQGRAMGLEAPELMSGPFHDALEMSYFCDYGMIFVRSRKGISHNPEEYSSPEDIALGTQLLYRAARRIIESRKEERLCAT
ncbi:allantoate deiminase/N-carbamoyl-L-amino-acid hydrolase [Paenibacillus mucilaginosus]|uniref:M20 family metallo-hydrolase n=1 Tax=Paenibacillus mucilaginosus TaxID=61624 RepID=UPI003D1E126E